MITIALGCDRQGRTAAVGLEQQLRAAGFHARAVDLGGVDGFDMADFCGLYNGTSADVLQRLPSLEHDTEQPTTSAIAADRRFVVCDLAALESVEPPQFALPNELIVRAYHLIYGQSGSGKTFYALDRALRLAANGRRVLYIATEDLAGLKIRIRAWQRTYPKVAIDTFRWLSMPVGLNLLDHAQVAELLSTITPHGFDHVTVDTLRESHTGDENSSQDGALINQAVQQLVRAGMSVDVVHHAGVEERRPRGTTALFANADFVVRVTKDDTVITLHVDKVRNTVAPDDWRYTLSPIDTGVVDAEGQPVLSAVLVTAVGQDVQTDLSPLHRAILETLALPIFEHGARMQNLMTFIDAKERTIFRALSTLKSKGFITQGTKGDPYIITGAGRTMVLSSSPATLQPHTPLPEPAKGNTASETPTVTTANPLPRNGDSTTATAATVTTLKGDSGRQLRQSGHSSPYHTVLSAIQACIDTGDLSGAEAVIAQHSTWGFDDELRDIQRRRAQQGEVYAH